jgi:putative phage-type endonuclease
LLIETPSNREEWLVKRHEGIGGSEAAAILGLSPYKSNEELWLEKTGQAEPEDISGKDCVVFGKLAELHLRELFALYAPQYEIEYHEFDLLKNEQYPFIFATLDGILHERETGRTGILEIKTTEIRKSTDWDKWDDKIPDQYYIQVLHQMLATGYDFAVLLANIRYFNPNDNFPRFQTKHYYIERSEVEEDIKYLLKEEIGFWTSVQNGRKPNLILPQI